MSDASRSAREKLKELEDRELLVFRTGWRGWPVWVWWIIVISMAWVASGLTVVFLCLTTWVTGEHVGVVGDSFGAMNTLFSGGALLGVVVAIFMQRRELQMQRLELELTREELERTADAQEKVLEVQLEEQRARILREDRAAQPEFKFDKIYMVYFSDDGEDFHYDWREGLPDYETACGFGLKVGLHISQYVPSNLGVEGLNYWATGTVHRLTPEEAQKSTAPYRLELHSEDGEMAPPENCGDGKIRIWYRDAMNRPKQQTFMISEDGTFNFIEMGSTTDV